MKSSVLKVESSAGLLKVDSKLSKECVGPWFELFFTKGENQPREGSIKVAFYLIIHYNILIK